MKKLHLDIETKSGVDLKEVGVYRYVEDPEFAILLFAYSIDGGEVRVVDLTEERMLPGKIRKALLDPDVEKHAYNAQFERVCLTKAFYLWYDPAQWHCTMAAAAYAGLGGNLSKVAKALGIPEEKDASGTRLINKFSKPPFANPEKNPEDWQRFIEYCRQDVAVEMAIADAISFWPMPEKERQIYILDQLINDRGVRIEPGLAASACAMIDSHTGDVEPQIIKITGVENPKSQKQMLGWLKTQGYMPDNLTKESVATSLTEDPLTDQARDVLELRSGGALGSLKKYYTARDAVCADSRIRPTVQYYGASRTGRWAGRLMQIQNLPRSTEKALGAARELLAAGDEEGLSLVFGSVPDILKQLIRPLIAPDPGKMFVTADFSSIEARIVAWLAGETWALEAFAAGRDIYKETAARMMKKPYEAVSKEDRQRGKIAVLALGYNGSTGALAQMGALKMGFSEEELKDIVWSWRRANKNIVRFWGKVGDAALAGAGHAGKIKFSTRAGALVITLPSGRELIYQQARVISGRLGGELSYVGQTTGGGLARIRTYGGKLTENIVQAVARDLLAHALMEAHGLGLDIVMHVHDEIVCETGAPEETNKALAFALAGNPPAWAEGLPLACDTEVMGYYR